MAEQENQDLPVQPQLGLWDAVSIIIGIVIGSSIYVIPSVVNGHLDSPLQVLGVWALGGVLGLVGALCYAELATTYPRMGGDYVYLNRAFGPWSGFLFGWAQLTVILPSSIGMMGFVFGEYAVQLCGIEEKAAPAATVYFALGAIAVLTVINILGVVMGKMTQNILSATKVIGLAGLVVAGLAYGQPSGAWAPHPPTDEHASFGTALILVLYAYGGWNDAAFVAADMRDRRHIPTTLLLGTGGVMVIYLLVNTAYIQALGFANAQGFNKEPIAFRTLGLISKQMADSMSILVMISALGAINGLLFAGSRVCSALGADHRIFAELGRWNPKLGSPIWSFVALAAISAMLVVAVGTETGQKTIDQALGFVGIPAIPWGKYFGGFNTLFAGSAPVFWAFFLMAGVSLFVLRTKDAGIERPFCLAAPWYPLLPIIFCGMCIFGLYSASIYAKYLCIIGIVPLLVGVPLYLLSPSRRAEGPAAAAPPAPPG